ncbi:hypothetical protein Tco_0996910, partial [Tanacetum coccineum]
MSSHLLRYAKIKPNGKLIYNSIVRGLYVRRMIPEPADDQAIQIILMGLPEDIYAAVDSCETTQEIWLHFQQMMKGTDIGIQDKKAKLFNEWERQIAQPGMNLGQDRQMQMVRVQTVGNRVVQNAVQNLSIQNVGNQNGLIVIPGIANQNLNPNRNGNVVAARAEGNAIGNNGNQISKHRHRVLRLTLLPSMIQMDRLSMEQSGGTVEQHPATAKETHALYDSLYNNLAIEVEKGNTVNRKMKETNADLTTELARYKNQEKCFEINQEKYDKLERCYQKSVYQEQCLTKKINALHLISAKTIMTLNEKIANLNNQLSKENSTVSFLNKEKKKLKSDFKIREDELLDKKIQLENKIKELDNIL